VKDVAKAHIGLQKMYLRGRNTLENSYQATINSLAFAIEARDTYTKGHSERVAVYAVWLGERLGINKKRLKLMQTCCRLHDVGKIGVPDKILLKPEKLTLERGPKWNFILSTEWIFWVILNLSIKIAVYPPSSRTL